MLYMRDIIFRIYLREFPLILTDKSANVWDHFVHSKPDRIADMSNGDIACDSYNNWKRDIEIAEELGLHFYR